MARTKIPYPPSPEDVPEDLAKPTSNYVTQVVAVLIGLIVFMMVYAGLVGLCIYGMIWCINNQTPVGVLPLAIFFVFLVKGFFNREKPDKTLHIEVLEEEQPVLFAFIRKLCDETGAPLPNKVFVSPEVNAAMMQELSLLNLFLPARRNLLIGLGLVNSLNLSEFKAVMAHEFGHFSQKSLALNQYVYVASRIVGTIVYGRDWFDRTLHKAKYLDIRIMLVVYVILGIVWIIRKILGGLFYIITLGRLGMSRQMEFNADLVAVSVAGSDAIVHALSRLDFANESLMHMLDELKVASDHELHTADLFFHHSHTANFLRRTRKKPDLGKPPKLIGRRGGRNVRVFKEGDESGIPPMWSSHPANWLREENAKEFYVTGEIDERSPWILFSDTDLLRERVTRKFYRLVFKMSKNTELDDPDRVQSFIDNERSETTYDPKYHGAYDNRPITPGELSELVDQVGNEVWDADRLARVHDRLYVELQERMPDYTKRIDEHSQLLDFLRAKDGPSEIEIRGKVRDRRAAKRMLERIDKDLEEQRKWFDSFDRRVFLVHAQMAYQISEDALRDLVKRYRFQLRIQGITTEAGATIRWVTATLESLSGQDEQLSPQVFKEITDVLKEARNFLKTTLRECRDVNIPVLKNFETGTVLSEFLLTKKLVSELPEQRFDSKWVMKLLDQLEEVRKRAARLHFKNLGTILMMQDEFALQWPVAQAAIAEVVTDEPPPPVGSKFVVLEDDEEVIPFVQLDLDDVPMPPPPKSPRRRDPKG